LIEAEHSGAPRWPDRVADSVRRWASRRVERRMREEWEAYRQSPGHPPEVKARWFRRHGSLPRTQNFRSLIQVNFYRAPRG
jgi:hypothetical protein